MSDTETTEVIFRKFKDGEVFALFPYEVITTHGLISSYSHVGQHSAATLDLIRNTKLATTQEYNTLKHELMSLGYKLKIISKVNNKKYCERWKQVMVASD